MSVFLTGDIHGKLQRRLGIKSFPEQKELDPNDDNYVIVLGDFGLIWDDQESKEERYLLRWLEEKPFTVLFIDGNHENHDRLSSMETIDFLGGKAHRISDKCYHLMRGEIYDICGKSFFCFGGAKSHDAENILDPKNDPNWKMKRKKLRRNYKSYRIIGRTWWEGEQATDEEFDHGLETLCDHDWKCDYVLTHTPPAGVLSLYSNGKYAPDKTSEYLEQFREKLDYDHWFFGHLHDESNVTPKDHLLYRQIFQLM